MAARAARETVVMDVPPQPDKPHTVLAHVSQAQGVTKPLTLEQKLENKGVGRQREAAPETSVSRFDVSTIRSIRRPDEGVMEITPTSHPMQDG